MFFDGYPNKGRCPTGTGHTAQGLNFSLPYGTAATATVQENWSYCEKCHGMFYDGYGDKGKCFAGGSHAAQGINFALPHSIPSSLLAQDKWRYCEKCHGMFYDGYPDKGRCPAGGGHNAQGLNFTLPHIGNTAAVSAADLKWMGVPMPMLATVALNEFGDAFRAGAKGQIPDDWLLKLDAKIQADPIGFKLGYSKGVLMGLIAGLKNLFETLFDISELAISLSAPVLIFRAGAEAFFLITDPTRVELRGRQIHYAKRIVTAAKATIDDINHNPDDYIELSKEVGEALGKSAGTWFSQDFLQRSATAIGEAVGEILGQVLFEIILQITIELTTAGVGNVARGGVAAGQGARGGTRVASIVESLKPLLKRTKGLQKFIQALIRDERGVLVLGKLRIPRAIQMETGGRYFTRVALDRKLLEMAAEFRLAKVGLTEENFFQNVAVARVKVWPSVAAKEKGLPYTIEYIVADNIPGKMQHSEGLVLDKLQQIKRQQKGVSIDQWYSERIPCANCKAYVLNNNANASIFYTVNEEAGRSAELMKQYGLIP